MITKEFTILNKLGIHARPAAQFVRAASNLTPILQWRRMKKLSMVKVLWG